MQDPNTETKTYRIGNIDFTMKKKFNLGELDFITEFFGSVMPGPNNKFVQGTFSNKDIIKFLSIALETDEVIPTDFSFGLCNEDIAVEIFGDFMVFKVTEFMKNFKTKNNLDAPFN
jgi:hypothetical protein